jgi:hypothetical protein
MSPAAARNAAFRICEVAATGGGGPVMLPKAADETGGAWNGWRAEQRNCGCISTVARNGGNHNA